MIVCSLCHRCYDDLVVSCTEEGHPLLSETRDGSPETIAGYRLDYLLESGMGGQIYRARETASGQSCRITIFSTDEEGSRQFLSEAQLAAALFHPNVVDIYEAGCLESGEVFVVAEDPHGQSLRELLNIVGVPHLLISIQVARQTAEALHVLHLKGLTHRAVAPENIILTTDAEHRLLVRIKDADFGGVSERSIVSNRFLIDSAINSLKYFAPEQCSGDAVSMKTDVYGLGIVLYEMLAGAPPFAATKAAALMEKQKSERPPDIRIDNFDLRMLLSHTLMESLHKRPERRQPSANALARQMRHIEQLATHVSTPPPAGVVPPPPPRTSAVAAAATVVPAQSSIPAPAVVMETQKENYTEYIPPVSAVIERRPLPVFEAERDLSAADLSDECKPTAVKDPGGLFDDLAGRISEGPAIENHVKHTIVPAAARQSRLRVRRRKLHSKTAPPSLEIPDLVSLPVVEIPRDTSARMRATAAEISARQVEPEQTAVVPLRSEPAAIEGQQPVDDSPWVADIPEVLLKEPINEIPVADSKPERMDAHPNEPAKIVWHQPEDDIPSVTDVLEVLSKEPSMKIARVQAEPEAFTQPEPEEITVVSPPGKRIRIDLKQPADPRGRLPVRRSPFQPRNEVTFFPTILGAAGKGKTIDPDQRDSMFSAYYPTRTRFTAPYRSLAVGGGIAVMAVVFLFSDDLVKSYSSAEDRGEPMEAKTVTNPASLPNTVKTVSVKPAEHLKTATKPVRDDSDESRSHPAPAKDRSPLSADISKDSAPKAGLRDPILKTPPASRNAGNKRDNGKLILKPEPDKNPADKKPLSSPNKTGNGTRPRIVNLPNP